MPLDHACENGNFHVAEYLVENGGDIGALRLFLTPGQSIEKSQQTQTARSQEFV
jgi:ankyrin repeat protein